MSETNEMPEPTTRGQVVWHSTEEDGGPDVGIHLAIGGGKSLWFGEISRRAWEEFPEEVRASGDDGGWWIVLHDGDDRFAIGKCACTYEARETVDRIAAALRGSAK